MARVKGSADNPLLAEVRRNRMVVRCIAGAVIVAWILAVLVFAAWQEGSTSVNSSNGAGKDHSAAPPSIQGGDTRGRAGEHAA